ncbi:hypothetical protein ABTY98_04175 [Streptomyces sp. NPDC096040]|uniref:hypothetical protein n=1 Tax=Streptomyces sp. NPDC096040 TaxID=3155541 RepID=UPI00332FA16F
MKGGAVGRAVPVGGSADPTRDGIVWAKGQRNVAETVEWSRVRYTGFSFLRVEAEAGTTPRLRVSAPARSGARVDHFEIRRGG